MHTDRLAQQLSAVVGPAHVLSDPALRASYETDFTGRYRGRARLVVRPAGTAQVAEVLRRCHAARVPVVAQGGNTGLVGGSVPTPDGGEVVLSLRRLDGVGAVDPAVGQVTVGAGVVLSELQSRVAAHGLRFGVDLAARDSATLGGMIATNAGGERVVRYGTTRANVAGLEAVLADGTVLDRLAGLPKDNTGYDLTGLLVGSEGTLAVVTRARLRLVPWLPRRVTALVGLDSPAAALDLVARLRPLDSLELAEFFTAEGLALVLRTSGLPAPFRTAYPVYLLVECAGRRDPAEELAEVLDAVEPGRTAVALADADRRRLAAYRERHTESINAAGIPLKLDVTVPVAELPGFVADLPGVLAGRGAAVSLRACRRGEPARQPVGGGGGGRGGGHRRGAGTGGGGGREHQRRARGGAGQGPLSAPEPVGGGDRGDAVGEGGAGSGGAAQPRCGAAPVTHPSAGAPPHERVAD
ncbi:hypothetical protein GCM10020295_30440 [Streptomyces cinereospinus]